MNKCCYFYFIIICFLESYLVSELLLTEGQYLAPLNAGAFAITKSHAITNIWLRTYLKWVVAEYRPTLNTWFLKGKRIVPP